MEIAIISDIHSNSFALDAVLQDIKKKHIRTIIVLGDIFGYYPWACETYELLMPYLDASHFIKGNHDQLLLDTVQPDNAPSYWKLAQANKRALQLKMPAAIDWLNSLSFSKCIYIDEKKLQLFHGTPSDEANGRFYPDHAISDEKFLDTKGIILLGHTHYPLLKIDESSQRIIFNPGSVGQPRDSNPNPSWGIFDTKSEKFSFERSSYNYLEVAGLLTQISWDAHAIAAIQKTYSGPLLNKDQNSK